MEVVAEEVSACVSTMAVKDRKERAFRPSIALFIRWFLYIEHDAYPVFIIITDDALVCIGGVALDHAVFFN